LQQDLQAMSLTSVNQRFATLTQEIIQLMNERNEESAARVQGELKAARGAGGDAGDAGIGVPLAGQKSYKSEQIEQKGFLRFERFLAERQIITDPPQTPPLLASRW